MPAWVMWSLIGFGVLVAIDISVKLKLIAHYTDRMIVRLDAIEGYMRNDRKLEVLWKIHEELERIRTRN